MPRRKTGRREYGSGSVYRRSDGIWVGTLEAGTTTSGKRRRITVSAKDETTCRQRLRDKKHALAVSGDTDVSPRATVKSWADEWLELESRRLRPNAFNATRSAVTRWIVPTIGHRRFDQLTPADVRAVINAQREAGRTGGTQLRTHSTLMSLLKAALLEGYPVTDRLLAVRAPAVGNNDRTSMHLEEAVAVLGLASEIPQASRWVSALLNGVRQGEALGLTWNEGIDFRRDRLVLGWQLQPLPYNVARDRSSGFRVPDGYESCQLHGRLHLVRPKSKAGWRVIPMVPWFRDSLEVWRDVAPDSPHGLVWPLVDGRPCPSSIDDSEWYALQAGADVHHPSGRFYTIHETRHTTATLLHELGVDPAIIAAILGQTKLVESYVHVQRSLRVAAALQAVAEQLQPPDND